MLSFLKNAPVFKGRNLVFRIIIPIIAFISSIFIFAFVIVGIKSNYSLVTATPAHLVFKSLFGASLLICSILYALAKNVPLSGLCSFFGFVASLFPLIQSIKDYFAAKSFAEQFSMTQDFSSYWTTTGVYALYALLCLSVFLYSTGFFPYPVPILVLCALSFLATIFITIERIVAYNLEPFSIMCFAYAALAVVIPVLFVLSTKKPEVNKNTSEIKKGKKV